MIKTPVSLLLRLRNADDQAARERLVTLFLPFVTKWSRRLGLPPQDAEDLVQDVFTTLFERFAVSQYNPEKSFRGWLFGMMRHKARAKRKDAFERKRVPLDLGAVPAHEVSEPDDGTFERELVRSALEVIRTEVELKTFEAFVRCKLKGQPAQEVAKELKMTEAAVYKAVSRVMQRLRTDLEGFLNL